jgi:hypothetical protein
MKEPSGDREEVGRWQGGEAALPSANLFHIKGKERHCVSAFNFFFSGLLFLVRFKYLIFPRNFGTNDLLL